MYFCFFKEEEGMGGGFWCLELGGLFFGFFFFFFFFFFFQIKLLIIINLPNYSPLLTSLNAQQQPYTIKQTYIISQFKLTTKLSTDKLNLTLLTRPIYPENHFLHSILSLHIQKQLKYINTFTFCDHKFRIARVVSYIKRTLKPP
eukprot:TRINITY_DN28530_c0_g1_i1.p2 TRINITY_DN28530_c0_g1~~TRINITY_DN28530_c0_g1_i1.p2  ORF type:complete len:145 (-),score=2.81 TRINITY_DN28530_c0_g1_i1:105-539(-)